ncbi:major facilitator superfamily domain-containing protein [Aspergillus pseudodeflectus]|uniref:Major facilitator superfamily domain-containing protein n=1 Tax=Aspergillus pseudodeflectus TaxID=176178 RepID=A0ABR4KH66_9EURO
MITPQQTPLAGSMTVSDRAHLQAHLHHGPNFGNQGQSETESSPTIQLDERDPMHPYNMGLLRKWLAVATVSTGSLCVACTSSIYSTTYGQLKKEFNCSHEIATLGLSLFIWGMGVGPLILAPLSEIYGRKIIYLSSLTSFFIWLLPCAVATNVQTLLIGRFLNGFSGSAFLSVAGGTVNDLFPRHHLAFPMMVYTASPFIGPEIGPLLGGFINQYAHWRWTFYMLLCWTAVLILLVYLLVPETYQPVLLKQKRKQLGKQRDESQSQIKSFSRKRFLDSMYMPLLLLCLEPMCLCLCLYSAILLGILYLFFGAFQVVFQSVYGFELWQCGLSFLGLLVGMVLAVLSDPYWKSRYLRLERKHRALHRENFAFFPEWRLPPAIAGAPLVTTGLFIFAWTAYSNIHWVVPIIGSGIFGAGTVLVYSGVFTFLVDAYPVYAASALAANSFARSMFAGVFPLFGIQMYNRMGIHWASSFLAFLTLAMLPFP